MIPNSQLDEQIINEPTLNQTEQRPGNTDAVLSSSSISTKKVDVTIPRNSTHQARSEVKLEPQTATPRNKGGKSKSTTRASKDPRQLQMKDSFRTKSKPHPKNY